ncbi:regulatory protein RecX [Flavobacterium suncheonense]|uniref:Regulatory protein RecX n=1 Tax=Flavobacterium suncheonense GH29-5 = DSM 17707 TaxID=1121899 RepID=A0A0A2MCT9_9FLAO|nr:regulatory protein RecX [Flavobacterium suncheonense]KGO89248.1 recombinase RecX [Flavobacterium suncheonense GH29-5 = DSM 17707]
MNSNSLKIHTIAEIVKKLEYYCSYQERCHAEVTEKLKTFKLSAAEIDTIVVHLIENNFLNEERFAQSFARGKHNVKKWGKIRIVNELKCRQISQYNINAALKELPDETYYATFHELAEKHWNSLTETHPAKKKKKFCDFLLRKGWESPLILDKLNELAHD